MGIACRGGGALRWGATSECWREASRAIGPFAGVAEMVALVMTRRVKPRVVGGQGTTRRNAVGHAKFSKWDRDFMLQLSTP